MQVIVCIVGIDQEVIDVYGIGVVEIKVDLFLGCEVIFRVFYCLGCCWEGIFKGFQVRLLQLLYFYVVYLCQGISNIVFVGDQFYGIIFFFLISDCWYFYC